MVTSTIRNSKKSHYQNLFHDIKSDIKKSWTVIYNIIRPKTSKKSSDIKSLLFNNLFTTNPTILHQFLMNISLP